jgi:predicted protein tyrosine phosphatase
MNKYTSPTFEQRKARINTVSDIAKQINLADRYVKALRASAKKAKSLDEKLEINRLQKNAATVLRKLRLACFDIEDEINLANTLGMLNSVNMLRYNGLLSINS